MLRQSVTVVSIVLFATGVAEAQWSASQLLNDPSEAGQDCKTVRIAASKYGGFHATYTNNNGGLRYRRYNGALQPVRTLFAAMHFNNAVTEALNGDVHVVFENWASGGPNVGWSRSVDGGISFSPVVNISSTSGCAKHPLITPFGTGGSAQVVMSYFRSGTTGGCGRQLYYARYDGSTWSADAYIGSLSHSEYDCFGMARSPLDGSIYRSFDPNGTSFAMRQFTGTWGPATTLLTGAWPVRQHMAINAVGQVMLLWDMDSRIYSLLYTPGVGPGPLTDVGPGGYSGSCDVCAIPGTNKFYMVLGRDTTHVTGRLWFDNAWQPEQFISNGLAPAFTVFPSVAADSTGTIYCAWEYWGSDKPQQYFSRMTSAHVVASPGSFARTVRMGGSLPDDVLRITNGGPGTLTYTVVSDVTWLGASPASGSAAFTDERTITIHYAPAALPTGTYTGHVIINSPGAYGNPKSITVTLRVDPISADFDGDADVDMADFALFQLCFNGPNAPPALGGSACAAPDLDSDGDVDLADFAAFQRCFNGPNRPPACL